MWLRFTYPVSRLHSHEVGKSGNGLQIFREIGNSFVEVFHLLSGTRPQHGTGFPVMYKSFDSTMFIRHQICYVVVTYIQQLRERESNSQKTPYKSADIPIAIPSVYILYHIVKVLSRCKLVWYSGRSTMWCASFPIYTSSRKSGGLSGPPPHTNVLVTRCPRLYQTN